MLELLQPFNVSSYKLIDHKCCANKFYRSFVAHTPVKHTFMECFEFFRKINTSHREKKADISDDFRQ